MAASAGGASGEASIHLATAVGAARLAIQAGLRRDDEAVLGPIAHHPVALTLRRAGEFCGGLVGNVQFGWFFVELLWVRADLRGTGQGRALMARGEAEAVCYGATKSFLNTFSFQAPGFYQKLGYREYARLDDFPAGHQRIFMTKAL